jgi:alginate O-acetyltransferase complex protein AlgI
VRFMDRVFENPASFSGFENMMALYGYSLQVYADFSGYTDMAIGLAMMLGFRLPKNFDSPYKAVSVSDFWRRWHISLSTWLRDYLYIPMGGNRGGSWFMFIALGVIMLFVLLAAGTWTAVAYAAGASLLLVLTARLFEAFRKWLVTNINMLITMLLGGLWHGPGWNFVIWGGLNGLGLLVFKLWNKVSPWKNKQLIFNRVIGIFLTFNFITFTRIWFRSGSRNTWEEYDEVRDLSADFDSANMMLNQLIHKLDFGIAWQVLAGYSEVFIVMLAGFVIHWLPSRWKRKYRWTFARSGYAWQLAACGLVIVLVYQVIAAGTRPFIYFQF